MQTIDLSENKLTSAAGETLAKHLPEYTKLETLMYAFTSLSVINHLQALTTSLVLLLSRALLV